jgi:basic membrane lipoprotein Med (substrate-binding protein (PBP1-ABC) superfamily)
MTHLTSPRQIAVATRRRLALPLLAAAAVATAALAASGPTRDATSDPAQPPRVLLVVDASERRDPAVTARAAAALRAAEGIDGQLRVTRTPTEQLAVTHLFAAKGYDAIVGVGLDARTAVAPVARRYPDVRFVRADARDLGDALARSARSGVTG